MLTKHEDLIHDIAYDFYGKRLATCSSDQHIKVWDLDDVHGWVCTSQWKAHSGPIWRVDWAAPEFGQVIASCSSDRTICVWEESEGMSSSYVSTGFVHVVLENPPPCEPSSLYPPLACSDVLLSSGDQGKKWKLKATLGDAHDILSVKFAPSHLGLKLASCSNDGIVRIYEALDITNLSQWQITDQFEVTEGESKGTTCLAWNTSPFDAATIAVGTQSSSPQIWQYNDKFRKWELIAVLGKDSSQKEGGHKDSIHDIAWAPNLGRSYHLVATASKDRTAKIWQLEANAKGKWNVKEVASFPNHNNEVWRVEWNITGTILASSGDDGTVRLWKCSYQNEWQCLNIITGSGAQD